MNGTTTNGNGHLNANKVRLHPHKAMMTRLILINPTELIPLHQ
jgi:hypothetical protein